MVCPELEHLEESEVAFSRSTGSADVAHQLLGGEEEAFEVHQCAVLSVGLEPACSTHFESRVVAGLCQAPCGFGSRPWQGGSCGRSVPVLSERLGGGRPAGSTEPALQHLCLALCKVPWVQLGVPGEAPSACRPVSWGAGRALGSAGSRFETTSRAAQTSGAGALAGRFLPPFCGRELPFCSVLQLLSPRTRKYSGTKIFIWSTCLGCVDN